MRTRLLLLAVMMILSGCVTTTYRDGKVVENSEEGPSNQFTMAKASVAKPSNLSTNVRVELIPRKNNPELYEYRVAEVYPKTVFSQAGFKSGDVILSIDGKPIQTMADVISTPVRIGNGEFDKILVRRKGKNIILQAKN